MRKTKQKHFTVSMPADTDMINLRNRLNEISKIGKSANSKIANYILKLGK